MKKFIGVDLHKSSFTACYRSTDGEENFRQFKLKQIDLFKKTLKKEDEIAVEATGNSRHFRNAVIMHVSKVVVVDPGQFKVISSSVKKNDLKDAAELALFLEKGLLPQSRVMDQNRAHVRSLVGTRNSMVKQRTAFKNKIHSILNSHGIHTKRDSLDSQKGLKHVLSIDLNPLPKLEIQLLVSQIEQLNEAILTIEKELEKEENQLPGHKNLTSIKGIGNVGASLLLSIIGDIKDFAGPKQLAAYFGIVPRMKQTGETVHYGRITKRGNKMGRTTLIQCTWIAIRYNPILGDFYKRLNSRIGSKKAIVATARKFLNVIYLTLDKELIWEDFPNGVIKA